MSLLDRLATWVPFGAVPEIAPEDLHAALRRPDPPLILDVRTQTEWEQSRIAGAVSAPLPSLAERLAALPTDKSRPVVAICLSAHRSIPAVRILREHGFADVRQLRGGMLAWWARGLPTDKGAAR